jgi:protein TilB
VIEADDLTENTPEDRTKIYLELAAQKKEKEERGNVNAPKKRDYDSEQVEAVDKTRSVEKEIAESDVKQKNEGGWNFTWDEETTPGSLILTVDIAKHLDSSLVDVDVHPTYVSIIIKSKVSHLNVDPENFIIIILFLW